MALSGIARRNLSESRAAEPASYYRDPFPDAIDTMTTSLENNEPTGIGRTTFPYAAPTGSPTPLFYIISH